MDERQQKLFQTSLFLGKLLAAGAVFQTFIFLYPETYGIQSWYAGMITGLLNSLGLEATSSSHYVLMDSGIYRITQDCLGWKSMAAFTGLVFASGPLRRHYRFLLAGFLTLMIANVVRVVSTVYLSHTGFVSFDIIHGTLWKWGLTALVLIIWFYWFRRRGNL